jgi:hypothetical protein
MVCEKKNLARVFGRTSALGAHAADEAPAKTFVPQNANLVVFAAAFAAVHKGLGLEAVVDELAKCLLRNHPRVFLGRQRCRVASHGVKTRLAKVDGRSHVAVIAHIARVARNDAYLLG